MSKQKFLVIQTAFLGDAVLTLPMIQQLKINFPSSQIDVVSIPSTSEIFNASPNVDNTIVYDKRNSQRSIFQLFKFVSRIKKNKYDRIYSPHRSFRTSMIVWLSGVKDTYGFDTSSFAFVYKNKIKYEPKIHEVARNLRLIGFDIQNDNWKIKPEIKVTQAIKSKIASMLSIGPGIKFAAVAPGSVWETKKYPQQYYEKIIKSLLEKNHFVILIGGKDDRILCEYLEKTFQSNIKSFAGRLNIIESIELIKNCSLLVCNDSAPTHMGMIAGIPTLTIYCSTVPDFGFYPYTENSSFISFNDLSCKPCGIHGHKKCPVKTFECAYKLLPEQIIDKINSMTI